MARAATTSDAFNAVAELRRREILDYLAGSERPVGDIVEALSIAQPSVSKHLRVLRDVGLVDVRRKGRQVFYRTNGEAIRPLLLDWLGEDVCLPGASGAGTQRAITALYFPHSRRHERSFALHA